MGADLFESYVGSIIGTMVLGAVFIGSATVGNGAWTDNFGGLSAVLLPLVLASVGIITSIIGTFFVRVGEGGDPQKALNRGEFIAGGIMIALTYLIATWMLPESWTLNGETYTPIGIFLAVIIGLISGVLIGVVTELSLIHI